MMACYAAWNKSEDMLMQSTSGGMFTALALPVLRAGGIVVGAAYGEGLRVEHHVAHTEEELVPLCGVKYVYSEIGKAVYGEMDAAIHSGRQILFVGTPCQAVAVRKRFGSPECLLICDLVCFGAPSNELWLKYVTWREAQKGKRLKYVSPRDKKSHGWGRKTYFRYEWVDGDVSRRCSTYDPYAHIFYSTLGFRKCCFACPFKGIDRVSDLTLGDFWGAEKIGLKSTILNTGVSGVLVHTRVGMERFLQADVCKELVNVDLFLVGNPMVRDCAKMPNEWFKFADDARRLEFAELIQKYHLQISRWQTIRRGLFSTLIKYMPQCVKKAVCFSKGGVRT